MPKLRYKLALKKSLNLAISSLVRGSPLIVERAGPKGLMLSTSSSFESLIMNKFPLEFYEREDVYRVLSVVRRYPTKWPGVVR